MEEQAKSRDGAWAERKPELALRHFMHPNALLQLESNASDAPWTTPWGSKFRLSWLPAIKKTAVPSETFEFPLDAHRLACITIPSAKEACARKMPGRTILHSLRETGGVPMVEGSWPYACALAKVWVSSQDDSARDRIPYLDVGGFWIDMRMGVSAISKHALPKLVNIQGSAYAPQDQDMDWPWDMLEAASEQLLDACVSVCIDCGDDWRSDPLLGYHGAKMEAASLRRQLENQTPKRNATSGRSSCL